LLFLGISKTPTLEGLPEFPARRSIYDLSLRTSPTSTRHPPSSSLHQAAFHQITFDQIASSEFDGWA
ncbi:MAG: hypothetical protein ACRD9W_13620, partial [Terriglobia bacterium]